MIESGLLKKEKRAKCLKLGSYVMYPSPHTRVYQRVKAIFKLRGNRDREELAHCTVLTMPVEEFSYVQYSTLP